MTIKVRYSSIDGFSQTRTFKTLAGARAYAEKWVGAAPDIGWGWGTPYAVSFDGIGKVTVSGDATLATVFATDQATQFASSEADPDSDWEGPNRYT